MSVKLRDTMGLTVYMVTHDLDSLFSACDRVAVLGNKKVLVEGTIEDMLASEEPWVKSYFRGKRARQLDLVEQEHRITGADGNSSQLRHRRHFHAGGGYGGVRVHLLDGGDRRSGRNVVAADTHSGLRIGSGARQRGLFNGVKVGDVQRVYIDVTQSDRGDRRHAGRPQTPITALPRPVIGIAGLTGTGEYRNEGRGSLNEPNLLRGRGEGRSPRSSPIHRR